MNVGRTTREKKRKKNEEDENTCRTDFHPGRYPSYFTHAPPAPPQPLPPQAFHRRHTPRPSAMWGASSSTSSSTILDGDRKLSAAPQEKDQKLPAPSSYLEFTRVQGKEAIKTALEGIREGLAKRACKMAELERDMQLTSQRRLFLIKDGFTNNFERRLQQLATGQPNRSLLEALPLGSEKACTEAL